MDSAQSLIQGYNAGFYACIVLSVLALIGAVAMFFLFDIRTNFLLRTNRAQQISVKKTKEKNAKTDPLNNQQAVNMDFSTDDLIGSGEETLASASETEAFINQTGEGPGPADWTTQPTVASVPATIKFKIIEDTVVVHTDEVI